MSEIDLDKDIWLPLVRASDGDLYFPETIWDDDSFRGCTDLIGDGLVKVFKFNARSGRIADATYEFGEAVVDANKSFYGTIDDEDTAIIAFLKANRIPFNQAKDVYDGPDYHETERLTKKELLG